MLLSSLHIFKFSKTVCPKTLVLKKDRNKEKQSNNTRGSRSRKRRPVRNKRKSAEDPEKYWGRFQCKCKNR
jgi:hypothetical protein